MLRGLKLLICSVSVVLGVLILAIASIIAYVLFDVGLFLISYGVNETYDNKNRNTYNSR